MPRMKAFTPLNPAALESPIDRSMVYDFMGKKGWIKNYKALSGKTIRPKTLIEHHCKLEAR